MRIMNRRKLRIREAGKDDEGRGLIRIDSEIVEALNLKNGDVIEISNIESDKKTAAFLFPRLLTQNHL